MVALVHATSTVYDMGGELDILIARTVSSPTSALRPGITVNNSKFLQ